MLFSTLSMILPWKASAQNSQPISIQQFSAPANGKTVTASLPIYKLGVVNGKLVDTKTGEVFNSFQPQSTMPTFVAPEGCQCQIRNLNWRGFYTTFYVVLPDQPDYLYVVRSCGKSPLQLFSTGIVDQYLNIDTSNFINHGQMAAASAGRAQGTTNNAIAAGEIDIIDGLIVYIDNCSGHFSPTAGSLLAYLSGLDQSGVLSLTSDLKSIIATGSITNDQIGENLIYMNFVHDAPPTRTIRAGTGGCNSYTTVFYPTVSGDSTTLTGGLLAYLKGNIQISQNSINRFTNRNIKGIELTWNFGWYNYSVWVTTDWHFYNNYMNFKFTDETNDTYRLSIHMSTYNHEVDYDSAKPNIKRIVFH